MLRLRLRADMRRRPHRPLRQTGGSDWPSSKQFLLRKADEHDGSSSRALDQGGSEGALNPSLVGAPRPVALHDCGGGMTNPLQITAKLGELPETLLKVVGV